MMPECYDSLWNFFIIYTRILSCEVEQTTERINSNVSHTNSSQQMNLHVKCVIRLGGAWSLNANKHITHREISQQIHYIFYVNTRTPPAHKLQIFILINVLLEGLSHDKETEPTPICFALLFLFISHARLHGRLMPFSVFMCDTIKSICIFHLLFGIICEWSSKFM